MFGIRRYLQFPAELERQLTERLRSHVNVLAGLIGPRYPAKPSSMQAAAAYIGGSLLKLATP